MNGSLGALAHHPASLMVTAVIVLFAVRQAQRHWGGGSGQDLLPGRGATFGGIAAGVLTGNGLVHFLHGAAGEHLSAPFAFLFAAPLAGYWLNVAWGGFCLFLGLRMTLRYAPQNPTRFANLFALGLVLIGAVLAWIFGK